MMESLVAEQVRIEDRMAKLQKPNWLVKLRRRFAGFDDIGDRIAQLQGQWDEIQTKKARLRPCRYCLFQS